MDPISSFGNESWRFRCTAIATFSYGTATDGGAPFTREALLEIGSCTNTFTTMLLALPINGNQIVSDSPAQKYMFIGYTLGAQQLTPLELATSPRECGTTRPTCRARSNREASSTTR